MLALICCLSLFMREVFLAVTGTEALYADMGHFGRPALRGLAVAASMAMLSITTTGATVS